MSDTSLEPEQPAWVEEVIAYWIEFQRRIDSRLAYGREHWLRPRHPSFGDPSGGDAA